MNEHKSLKEVQRTLRNEHGFDASIRSFRSRLDDWGFKRGIHKRKRSSSRTQDHRPAKARVVENGEGSDRSRSRTPTLMLTSQDHENIMSSAHRSLFSVPSVPRLPPTTSSSVHDRGADIAKSSSPYGVFSDRIRAANNGHMATSMSMNTVGHREQSVFTNGSPFRHESALAPEDPNPPPLSVYYSAEAERRRQKDQKAAVATQRDRYSTTSEILSTISPREAMIDYDETENRIAIPFFVPHRVPIDQKTIQLSNQGFPNDNASCTMLRQNSSSQSSSPQNATSPLFQQNLALERQIAPNMQSEASNHSSIPVRIGPSTAADTLSIIRGLPDDTAAVVPRLTTPLHQAALHNREADIDQHIRYVNVRDERNMTPLHHAAARGLYPIVKRLIEAGAMVDAKGIAGRTPLHLSVVSLSNEIGRSSETFDLLLQAGPNINSVDFDRNTPLHLALQGSNLGPNCTKAIQAILQYRDTANWLQADVNLSNRSGVTPFHLALGRLPYSWDAENVWAKCLIPFIEEGDISVKTQDQRFPFQVFLERVFSTFISMLWEPQSDRAQEVFQMVKIFIRKGADLESTSSAGESFISLYFKHHLWRFDEELKLTEQICKSVDVNKRGATGNSPLHELLGYDSIDTADRLYVKVLRILLQNGADPNQEDQAGNSPLAVLLGRKNTHAKNMAFVLLKSGAQPMQRDSLGDLPLYLAVRHQSKEDVPDLVDFQISAFMVSKECRTSIQQHSSVLDHEWWCRLAEISTPKAGWLEATKFFDDIVHKTLPDDVRDTIYQSAKRVVARRCLNRAKSIFDLARTKHGSAEGATRRRRDRFGEILSDCKTHGIAIEPIWTDHLVDMFRYVPHRATSQETETASSIGYSTHASDNSDVEAEPKSRTVVAEPVEISSGFNTRPLEESAEVIIEANGIPYSKVRLNSKDSSTFPPVSTLHTSVSDPQLKHPCGHVGCTRRFETKFKRQTHELQDHLQELVPTITNQPGSGSTLSLPLPVARQPPTPSNHDNHNNDQNHDLDDQNNQDQAQAQIHSNKNAKIIITPSIANPNPNPSPSPKPNPSPPSSPTKSNSPAIYKKPLTHTLDPSPLSMLSAIAIGKQQVDEERDASSPTLRYWSALRAAFPDGGGGGGEWVGGNKGWEGGVDEG